MSNINTNNYKGLDSFGNRIYLRKAPDGTQFWAQTRNGQIQNAGINNSGQHYNYIPGKGLVKI